MSLFLYTTLPMLTSKNPYTWDINWTVEKISNEQITTILETAHEAYKSRKLTSFDERKSLFLKLADLMDERSDELAKLETIEMWRLYSASSKWIPWTARLIRRFANHTEEVLWKKEFTDLEKWTDGLLEWYSMHDPIWVIYGIAPWNFPFNQLLRAAVPNILAWNTQVYKHASNVPLCAQAIQQLFDDAWFPKGVYTALFISASQSEEIIAHPAVQWVHLTWSERAWAAIWALAGKYLKRSLLELWGNDAFVLLDHEDTAAMVAHATSCRVNNGGQRCNGSKRFIVLEKHYDEFVKLFGEHMSKQITGDPMDAATNVPPLSSNKLLHEVHDQVTRSIADWARLVTGWSILDEEKNLYAPTVLADVTLDMTSAREEVFWPAASVIKSKSIEESIALANNSEFWLSATVRWDDIEQLKAVAPQLEWWMVFINKAAWSKASLPFWWVRKSWYGKENGAEGLKAFTNKKVIIY